MRQLGGTIAKLCAKLMPVFGGGDLRIKLGRRVFTSLKIV